MRRVLARMRAKLPWQELVYVYFVFTLLVGLLAMGEMARSDVPAYQFFRDYIGLRLWPFFAGIAQFAFAEVVWIGRSLRDFSDGMSRESAVLAYLALFGIVLAALFGRVALVAYREQRLKASAAEGDGAGFPRLTLKAKAFNVLASFRELPIARKTAAGVGGLVLTAGVVMLAVATIVAQIYLPEQVSRRGLVAAADLAALAEALAAGGEVHRMDGLLKRHFSGGGLAYAVLQGPDGRVLASSLADGKEEAFRTLPPGGRAPRGTRSWRWQGSDVDEGYVPVADLGLVRVGVWSDLRKREVQAVLTSLTLSVTGFLIAGGLLWIFLVFRVFRPLHELAEAASRISTGDLTAKVRVASNDEFADLARALEAMRVSLNAALARLEQAKAESHSDTEKPKKRAPRSQS